MVTFTYLTKNKEKYCIPTASFKDSNTRIYQVYFYGASEDPENKVKCYPQEAEPSGIKLILLNPSLKQSTFFYTGNTINLTDKKYWNFNFLESKTQGGNKLYEWTPDSVYAATYPGEYELKIQLTKAAISEGYRWGPNSNIEDNVGVLTISWSIEEI